MAKVKIRLHDITGGYASANIKDKRGRMNLKYIPPKEDMIFKETYDIKKDDVCKIAEKLKEEYGYQTYYFDPARKPKKTKE